MMGCESHAAEGGDYQLLITNGPIVINARFRRIPFKHIEAIINRMFPTSR